MHQFPADGWFGIKVGDRVRNVASVKGVSGLDPRTLRGELVQIDETVYRVRRVETFCVTDPTGTDFSLMLDADLSDSEIQPPPKAGE